MANDGSLGPHPAFALESMTTLRALASILSPQASEERRSEGRPGPSQTHRSAYKECLMQSNVSHFNSGT